MQRIVKPGYVDPMVFAGGDSFRFRPPMLFREVTARAFPLKANIARLHEFVDQYLNMDIPDEVVHFTPALPYVYFMALNYGGMSATTIDAQRMGWVAQHEAFFLIPLQRWRREHGKLKFKGWTGVTPFIFVDDPLSMIIGREIYGWPKALAHIEPDRPVWTTHPRAPTRLFTMSANVFPDVYAGKREPRRTLVAIERDTPASYAEYPPNYRCPWTITSVVHNVYATSFSLMEEAAEIASNLRLRGYPDVRTPEAMYEMAQEVWALGAQAMAGFSPIPLGETGHPMSGAGARLALIEDLPRYFSSTINLKQFRDPEQPDRACYSALVESTMGVDRLNQVGLLGDWDLLRGDKSGGYSINIARYQALPIIETLGIEVPNLYENAREGDVVKLRPSFPFWMDVDLYYGAGDVICSRTPNVRDGEWIEEWSEQEERGRHQVGSWQGRTRRPGAHRDAYNNALGAATLPVAGPIHYPDLTLQVYPLLADRATLQGFVDECWSQLFKNGMSPQKMSVEVAGGYVYMIVASVGDKYGRMWSETQNIGWWAEREVSFSIPVRWKLDGVLKGLAVIEPLVFADKPRALVTYREVNGRNAFQADIDSPDDVWISPGGPDAPRRLLRLTTESFLELGFGLGSPTKTLIEIDERAPLPDGDIAGWREIAEDWGRAYADELQRKSRAWATQPQAIGAAQALALEAFANGAPLHRLTLKQYRDAAEFDRACYQSVVQTQRRVERVHAMGEIEHPLRISLHQRANYPLVKTFGLKVKHTRSNDSVVDELEPVRPFWLRVSLVEDLGRVVATVDPHLEPDSAPETPRQWLFAKPGPRRPGVTAPPSYFDEKGATAVGPRMVEAMREGVGPGGLTVLARRMLMKELHALRIAARRLPARARASLPPALFAEGADFAAQSLERLRDLVDALRAAMPSWEPPESRLVRVRQLRRLAALALDAPPSPQDPELRRRAEALARAFSAPESPTDPELRGDDAVRLYELFVALSREAGEAPVALASTGEAPASWLIGLAKQVEAWVLKAERMPREAARALRRLQESRFVAEYDFDADRLAALEAAFDPGALNALRALAAAKAPFAELQRLSDDAREAGAAPDFDPTAALTLVAQTLEGDVADWAEPARFLRLTRKEAKQAVETLDDLQLVFEAILDDHWTGQGPPRRGPRARMPAASLGPLGRDDAAWAAANGLKRIAPEGEPPFFVVAADAP